MEGLPNIIFALITDLNFLKIFSSTLTLQSLDFFFQKSATARLVQTPGFEPGRPQALRWPRPVGPSRQNGLTLGGIVTACAGYFRLNPPSNGHVVDSKRTEAISTELA